VPCGLGALPLRDVEEVFLRLPRLAQGVLLVGEGALLLLVGGGADVLLVGKGVVLYQLVAVDAWVHRRLRGCVLPYRRLLREAAADARLLGEGVVWRARLVCEAAVDVHLTCGDVVRRARLVCESVVDVRLTCEGA